MAAFAQAGALAAAVLLALGVLSFAAQRHTEPAAHCEAPSGTPRHSLILLGNLRALALVMAGLGAITGTVDVAGIAFAMQRGVPAAAILVLSAYAVGSFGAGLLLGMLQHEMSLPRLLRWCTLATALGTLPLPWAPGIASLSLLLLITGLFVAPTMIVTMTLVEKTVPASRLTEALTWLITGLNLGIAAGAMCAGRIVDAYGARAGFGIALAAGAFALLAAWRKPHSFSA